MTVMTSRKYIMFVECWGDLVANAANCPFLKNTGK